jgi:hypothetical protein
MNIHIEEKLYNQISENNIGRFIIGSRLYKIDDDSSDYDFMNIYTPFINEVYSCFQNHHQYKYKHNNTDEICTSLPQFIKNIFTGDYTINFELIHSEDILNTPLEFIYKNRHIFYTYDVIKSYLGFAKRDLTLITKEPTERDKNKKCMHVYRSYYTVNKIFDNKFTLNFDDEFYKNIDNIRNFTHKERNEFTLEYEFKIKSIRNYLNKINFKKTLTPQEQNNIDEFVLSFRSNKSINLSQTYSSNIEIVY